jgi:hypothetical protein
MFSGTQALPENRGHMFAPVWSKTMKTIWTSPLDRSRRVDQDSYVERPNRSSYEGDITYTRSARQAHRYDRCT